MKTATEKQLMVGELLDRMETERGYRVSRVTIHNWTTKGFQGRKLKPSGAKGNFRLYRWSVFEKFLDWMDKVRNGEPADPEQLPKSPAAKRKKVNRKAKKIK